MRHVLSAIPLFLLIAAGTAQAGYSETTTTDGCQVHEDGGAVLKPEGSRTDVYRNVYQEVTSVSHSIVKGVHHPISGTWYNRCWITTTTQIHTFPGGPKTGSTRSSTRALLRRVINSIFYGSTNRGSKNKGSTGKPDRKYWNRNSLAPGGVRGSLGFSLAENSPAYTFDTLNVDIEALQSGSTVTVPFIVESTGDGDWLSIAIGTEIVWNQPLSDFIEGELNVAEIPVEVFDSYLPGDEALLGIYLESANEANAEVFIVTEIEEVTDTKIDIQSWSGANEIQPLSSKLIFVTILSTSVADGDAADVDATQIDPATVLFGDLGASNVAAPLVQDLDGDADADVILGFRTQDTGIRCGDTDVYLDGETYSGEVIDAIDSIATTDCEATGGCHP